ncbi:esterase E4-like [Anticarsia gemmatalis]|uniref:esterase E4-like n=1 Tax=Anticarsia gemmatalis TaxID=129554 RepID=UPI003F76B0EA
MEVVVWIIVASAQDVLCRRLAVYKPHRDVVTPQGTVRGYLTPSHAAYYGIPYARPPIRTDRFKAPEPPPIWDGIFEATHKIKCPQPDEDGDENCLVVNVFTPKRQTSLPVYVIVHDGNFQNGWGSYDPPDRLLKEGFVVVTFNYRIGALGFLCLGTAEALGNAGLKDQIAALYWVHKNIEFFGGNPGEITAHGVGNGAVSLQLLLLSGLIEDLVHKVILESGSVLAADSMAYDPLSTAYQGATALGYEGTSDTEELTKFYHNTPWKELVKIQELFLPCVEDGTSAYNLIDFNPIHRLKEGNYNKIPVLLTLTNDAINITESLDKPPENMAELLPSNLEFDDDVIKQRVGEIVKEFYFGSDIFIVDDVEQNYFDFYHDISFEYPIAKFALLYAALGSHMVYLMKFTMDRDESEEPRASSGIIMDNLYRGEEDDDAFNKMMNLWRSFIKLGDPTPLTTSVIPLIWQPVVTDKNDDKAIATIPTLIFGTELKMSPENQRLLFWDNIYGRFYKPHVIKQEHPDDVKDSE